MTPSYAFVGEPETNGVIERFFRTLKEQIVHGRIYQTIDEVRDAVRDFVARYNAGWLIEKNGLRSPVRCQSSVASGCYEGRRLTAIFCPKNRARYTRYRRIERGKLLAHKSLTIVKSDCIVLQSKIWPRRTRPWSA